MIITVSNKTNSYFDSIMSKGAINVYDGSPIDTNFRFKVTSVLNFVRTCNKDTVVMYVDGLDVTIRDAVAPFRIFDNGDKILFAAEKNCYPNKNIAHLYPPTLSVYKYLNAGCFIGKAGMIEEMCENVLLMEQNIDQLQFSCYFIQNQDKVAIDKNCSIFQCMYMDNGEMDLVSGVNQYTRTLPSVIHFNGKSGA